MIRKTVLWTLLVVTVVAGYLYVPAIQHGVDSTLAWISGWFSSSDADVAGTQLTLPTPTVAANVVSAAEPESAPIRPVESIQPTKASYSIRDFGYTYDERRRSPFAPPAKAASEEVKGTTWFSVNAIVYNASSPANSSAILHVTRTAQDVRGSDESQVSYIPVRVGQIVEGYEVVSILADRVVLREVNTSKEIEVIMK